MTTPMEANGYILAYERESDPDDFAGIETSTGPDPQLTTQEEWEEHMDAQPVDINRLNELHAAAITQLDHPAHSDYRDWIHRITDAWPAVSAELTRLFERRVHASIHFSQTEYGDGREAERDLAWLDGQATKAGE